MDDGQEIPGLNEGYTFMGAKVLEWVAGFTMFVISGDLVHTFFGIRPTQVTPILLMILFGTTICISTIRRKFPDEERGMLNAFADFMGWVPPGLPPQSSVQPYWSGAPIRNIPKKTYFRDLALDEVFYEAEEKDIGEEFFEKLVSNEVK